MQDVNGNSVDIKNLLEVLKGLELVAGVAGHVAADGKVNLADLPKLLPLVQNHQVLLDAVKGADEIKAEIKDLDALEITQVIQSIMAVIKAFKEGKSK
jgi:hypothetical protein